MSPRPWRVLHVITRLDRGGSADNTLLTVLHMDRARFASTVVTGPGSGQASELKADVARRQIPLVELAALRRAGSPVQDLRALAGLWSVMRRGSFDLVHTHTSKAGLLGRIAARLARIPVVVHTPHGHVFYGYYGWWITRLFILLERGATRLTDRLVALTEKEVADYARLGVAQPSRCVVIPSGVDFSPFQHAAACDDVRRELGIPCDAWVIGTVGRLTAVKGQEILVKASARLRRAAGSRPVWLLLVGDGEEREALRRLAIRLNILERVVMPGWRQDVPSLLGAMDVFALPSLNEGMGKALVEAMYAGLPCVASRVGGVADVLDDRREGLLVPAGDEDALVQALETMIRRPEWGRALGRAAHRRAAKLSVESMVSRLEALYEELLNDGPQS